jgi:hypothetical protein
MTFIPIYLIGIAAAGIPLVLHLIYRRQAQKVLFATIRFLKLSNERTAHRRRVQDLLLLLLRSLLFVLLALALAQFIVKLTEGSGLGGAKADVAIVMDNSYSMAAVHEGRQSYAAAKDAAFALLRSLQPEDRVAVLFTSGPERRSEVELSRDLQEAQAIVNRSVVSAEGGSAMAALRKAQDLLLEARGGLRQICVLTDAQKRAWETGSGWDQQAESVLERDKRASIPVVVFDAGRPVTRNLAVDRVRVSGQAFVRGTPVTIDADVTNTTGEPTTALVGLHVSGEAKGSRKLDLPPGGTATASFAYELPESGTAHVEVRLPEDMLATDNRRSLKLDVKEKIRALIVQEGKSAVAFLNQSYFLERALDPSIALGGEPLSIIRPDRLAAAELGRAKLGEYDVVFVLGVRTFNEAAAAALREFVGNGGGLVFFAGEGLDVASYRRQFAAGPDPILPLPLVPIPTAPADRKVFKSVTSVHDTHFVFAPFRGLNILKAVRVYKSATINLHASTPMVALAHLADGQPLLLVHSAGKGNVAFVAVTADASWSNLPVTDVFLPMIHQLVYHVCGSFEASDSLAVGAPFRFSFPSATEPVEIDVRRPDGVEESITTKPTDADNAAVYANTFTPGYYRYVTRGGAQKQGAFVVNPDTAESNLDRIEEVELAEHLDPVRASTFKTVEDMQKEVAALRKGVHLRDLFILVAIAAAVFETVISNWVTPKHERRKSLFATAEASGGEAQANAGEEAP